MEKYAVEFDNQKVKTAQIGTICPSCGATTSGTQPHCRNCGTEPFEKKHGHPHGKDSQNC